MADDPSDLYLHPLLYDVEHLGFRGDLRFYDQVCAAAAPPRSLELGCGTGRLSLALAERGHRVDGLDLSVEMLERAELNRTRLGPGAVPPRFLRGDFLSHRGEAGGCGAVLAAFNTLQHCRPDTLDALLATVRHHLAAGGIFAADLFAPLAPAQQPDETEFGDLDARAGPDGERWQVARRSRLAADGRTLLTEYRFERRSAAGALLEQGQCTLARYQWRPEELQAGLVAAGFRAVEIFADFTGAPWQPGAGRLVLRARRG